MVELLIRHGADPYQALHNQASVLHVCAERGFDAITGLICKVAPKLPLKQDKDGNTALHVAAEWDQLEIIEILTDQEESRKLTCEIKNGEGLTAVDVAYNSNSQEGYPYLCHKFNLT